MHDVAILHTRDINLAAAIASHDGCRFYSVEPVQIYKERQPDGSTKEYYSFRFESTPEARKIFAAWGDGKFTEKDENDSFISYLKAFVHNRNRLLDHVKGEQPWNVVKQGRRIFFVKKKGDLIHDRRDHQGS